MYYRLYKKPFSSYLCSKNQYFLIIFIVLNISTFILNSCGNKNDEFVIFHHSNGVVRSKVGVKDKLQHGLFWSYYTTGELKQTGNYFKNSRNGIFKTFFKSGKVQNIEHYTMDTKDSIAIVYDEMGNLETECSYKNDKKEGAFKSYYKDKKIFQHFFYKEGEMDGAQKVYYSNGQTKKIFYKKNGFAGTGLLLYQENGEEIKDNNQLIIKEINELALTGKYKIQCKFSKSSKYDKFYIGDLVDGKYLSIGLFPVKIENGAFEHALTIAKGSFYMGKLTIIGHTKNEFGDEIVKFKELKLSVDNY